jgi:hypothetical protein
VQIRNPNNLKDPSTLKLRFITRGGINMPNEVTHTVTDIKKWENRFANMAAERKRHGVSSSRYLRKDGKVIVTHTVTDKDAQKAFRESQKGKDNRSDSSADEGQTDHHK